MYTFQQCQELKKRYNYERFEDIFGCEAYAKESTTTIITTTTTIETTSQTWVVFTPAPTATTSTSPQSQTVHEGIADAPDTNEEGQLSLEAFENFLFWIFVAHCSSIVLSALFLWTSAFIGNAFGESKLTRVLDSIGHFFCLSGRLLVSCLTMSKRIGGLLGLGRADGHVPMQTRWFQGRRDNREDTVETVV